MKSASRMIDDALKLALEVSRRRVKGRQLLNNYNNFHSTGLGRL